MNLNLKKHHFFLRLMFILQIVISLAACQKYNEKDFSPPNQGDSGVLKFSGGSMNGDTIQAAPNFVIKLWVDSLPSLLPGHSYIFNWNFGDGSSTLSTPRVEHEYLTAGIYHLVATINNTYNSNVIVKERWMKISVLYGQDNTILVLSSNPVSGGYNYKLGFLASTVSGFVEPPYTAYNIPFVTGTFVGWPFIPPNNPDFEYIEGALYLTRNIIFPNYDVQEIQFGQVVNWSYNPSSIYWVSTGPNQGKYRFYPLNGSIYNFSPNAYFPGEDGDSLNGIYPPTVRDTLILNQNPNKDSLRIFINYAQYANGSLPFMKYSLNGNWLARALIIIPGTGWGYRTISIIDIQSSNDRLYFKFGPNLVNPNDYGEMVNSKFFLPGQNMLGIQIGALKGSNSGYSVNPIIE